MKTEDPIARARDLFSDPKAQIRVKVSKMLSMFPQFEGWKRDIAITQVEASLKQLTDDEAMRVLKVLRE